MESRPDARIATGSGCVYGVSRGSHNRDWRPGKRPGRRVESNPEGSDGVMLKFDSVPVTVGLTGVMGTPTWNASVEEG